MRQDEVEAGVTSSIPPSPPHHHPPHPSDVVSRVGFGLLPHRVASSSSSYASTPPSASFSQQPSSDPHPSLNPTSSSSTVHDTTTDVAVEGGGGGRQRWKQGLERLARTPLDHPQRRRPRPQPAREKGSAVTATTTTARHEDPPPSPAQSPHESLEWMTQETQQLKESLHRMPQHLQDVITTTNCRSTSRTTKQQQHQQQQRRTLSSGSDSTVTTTVAELQEELHKVQTMYAETMTASVTKLEALEAEIKRFQQQQRQQQQQVPQREEDNLLLESPPSIPQQNEVQSERELRQQLKFDAIRARWEKTQQQQSAQIATLQRELKQAKKIIATLREPPSVNGGQSTKDLLSVAQDNSGAPQEEDYQRKWHEAQVKLRQMEAEWNQDKTQKKCREEDLEKKVITAKEFIAVRAKEVAALLAQYELVKRGYEDELFTIQQTIHTMQKPLGQVDPQSQEVLENDQAPSQHPPEFKSASTSSELTRDILKKDLLFAQSQLQEQRSIADAATAKLEDMEAIMADRLRKAEQRWLEQHAIQKATSPPEPSLDGRALEHLQLQLKEAHSTIESRDEEIKALRASSQVNTDANEARVAYTQQLEKDLEETKAACKEAEIQWQNSRRELEQQVQLISASELASNPKAEASRTREVAATVEKTHMDVALHREVEEAKGRLEKLHRLEASLAEADVKLEAQEKLAAEQHRAWETERNALQASISNQAAKLDSISQRNDELESRAMLLQAEIHRLRDLEKSISEERVAWGKERMSLVDSNTTLDAKMAAVVQDSASEFNAQQQSFLQEIVSLQKDKDALAASLDLKSLEQTTTVAMELERVKQDTTEVTADEKEFHPRDSEKSISDERTLWEHERRSLEESRDRVEAKLAATVAGIVSKLKAQQQTFSAQTAKLHEEKAALMAALEEKTQEVKAFAALTNGHEPGKHEVEGTRGVHEQSMSSGESQPRYVERGIEASGEESDAHLAMIEAMAVEREAWLEEKAGLAAKQSQLEEALASMSAELERFEETKASLLEAKTMLESQSKELTKERGVKVSREEIEAQLATIEAMSVEREAWLEEKAGLAAKQSQLEEAVASLSAGLERFEETKAALLEAQTRLENQSKELTNEKRTSKSLQVGLEKNREDLKNHASRVALANKLVAELREELLGKESLIKEIELQKEEANAQAEAANEELRVMESKFKAESATWNFENQEHASALAELRSEVEAKSVALDKAKSDFADLSHINTHLAKLLVESKNGREVFLKGEQEHEANVPMAEASLLGSSVTAERLQLEQREKEQIDLQSKVQELETRLREQKRQYEAVVDTPSEVEANAAKLASDERDQALAEVDSLRAAFRNVEEQLAEKTKVAAISQRLLKELKKQRDATKRELSDQLQSPRELGNVLNGPGDLKLEDANKALQAEAAMLRNKIVQLEASLTSSEEHSAGMETNFSELTGVMDRQIEVSNALHCALEEHKEELNEARRMLKKRIDSEQEVLKANDHLQTCLNEKEHEIKVLREQYVESRSAEVQAPGQEIHSVPPPSPIRKVVELETTVARFREETEDFKNHFLASLAEEGTRIDRLKSRLRRFRKESSSKTAAVSVSKKKRRRKKKKEVSKQPEAGSTLNEQPDAEKDLPNLNDLSQSSLYDHEIESLEEHQDESMSGKDDPLQEQEIYTVSPSSPTKKVVEMEATVAQLGEAKDNLKELCLSSLATEETRIDNLESRLRRLKSMKKKKKKKKKKGSIH